METNYESNLTKYIDTQTGEISILETQKVFTFCINSKEELYNIFIDFIGPALGVKQESLKKILTYLCCHANQKHGKVVISTAMREEICKKFNIAHSNLSRIINTLKNLDIIRGNKGDYYICKNLLFGNKLNNMPDKFSKPEKISITYNLIPNFQGE